MNAALIGIDLGTTGCRSAVFDENLNIFGEEYIEYTLINLSDREIEQDANEWWELTKKVVKASVEKSGINSERIKGISVSSQGIAVMPVDKECKPLRNAISWLDTRAVDETKLIIEKFDRFDVYKTTGKRINEAYTLPKLIWLKKNEPEVYNCTYKFLMPHDFITSKLCGAFTTDHTMASGTLAYDINMQKWWKEILETLGVEVEKLPEIKYSGTPVGIVIPEVAEEIGLPEGVVVSVGGQDQKCAALGAGIDEDTFTVSLGTATAVEKIFKSPAIDPEMRIPTFSYLFNNRWVMEGVIGTSCVSLKWFRNTLFSDKSYKELDSMVEEISDTAGNVFFYPFLSGSSSPYWYENSRGCFYGINLSTSAAELTKSVMEGIAYQIKSNIQVMEEVDRPADGIRVFGGGAASRVWCQIIADVIGKRLSTLYTSEPACLGAAILAGLGAGMYKNVDEINTNVRIKDVFEPDKDHVKAYEQKYKEYIKMQDKIMK